MTTAYDTLYESKRRMYLLDEKEALAAELAFTTDPGSVAESMNIKKIEAPAWSGSLLDSAESDRKYVLG